MSGSFWHSQVLNVLDLYLSISQVCNASLLASVAAIGSDVGMGGGIVRFGHVQSHSPLEL